MLEIVYLFDVDNTLLDNDRFADDLRARLQQSFGAAGCDRYWEIYDALRDELHYADYLGALQKLRLELQDDQDWLQMSAFLLEYPFAGRVYPRAFDVISHLSTLGVTA
ncbi:MAG: HAD family hydrolase, partial [Burkholderiaceae bacterium]